MFNSRLENFTWIFLTVSECLCRGKVYYGRLSEVRRRGQKFCTHFLAFGWSPLTKQDIIFSRREEKIKVTLKSSSESPHQDFLDLCLAKVIKAPPRPQLPLCHTRIISSETLWPYFSTRTLLQSWKTSIKLLSTWRAIFCQRRVIVNNHSFFIRSFCTTINVILSKKITTPAINKWHFITTSEQCECEREWMKQRAPPQINKEVWVRFQPEYRLIVHQRLEKSHQHEHWSTLAGCWIFRPKGER